MNLLATRPKLKCTEWTPLQNVGKVNGYIDKLMAIGRQKDQGNESCGMSQCLSLLANTSMSVFCRCNPPGDDDYMDYLTYEEGFESSGFLDGADLFDMENH